MASSFTQGWNSVLAAHEPTPRSSWTNRPLVGVQQQIPRLSIRKPQSTLEVITSHKTAEGKDFLPVVQIIKLSHEELEGAFPPRPGQGRGAGRAQDFAAGIGRCVGGLGVCACIAVQREGTLDLILIILTAIFEVQKWL